MSDNQPLSVSQLNHLLNKTLEKYIPQVVFEGEISQFTKAASGHLYFTVKDEDSQISAVMWRGVAQSLDFSPEAGLAVVCHAKPTVYAKGGRLQVIVHRMLPKGEGALQKKFLELKEKLSKEGLFLEDRKRVLPFLPKGIGIVTSKSGAVIHDIMTKMKERMPIMKNYLVDVRVQGEGAAEEIVEAIQMLNNSGLVDLIIVARGGGSLEDLWPFNEEIVVRAIFASKIPIISGVGHEVDITLSDLVADCRAPTPTAAAEMAVPKREDLLGTIADFERRLSDTDAWLQPLVQNLDELVRRLDDRIAFIVEQKRLMLETAEAKLAAIQPEKILTMLSAKLDLCGERLHASGKQMIILLQKRIDNTDARLRGALPIESLHNLQERVLLYEKRLGSGAEKVLDECRYALEKLASKLEVISPQKVLERGYSIVKCGDRVLRAASEVEIGEELAVSLAKGTVHADVVSKEEK